MIGVKGKQLCAGNPNADDRRTDGRTDGRTNRQTDRQTDTVIPVYPLTSLQGGIMITETHMTSIYYFAFIMNKTSPKRAYLSMQNEQTLQRTLATRLISEAVS